MIFVLSSSTEEYPKDGLGIKAKGTWQFDAAMFLISLIDKTRTVVGKGGAYYLGAW